MRICFATNNQHKLDEVRHGAGATLQILSLSDINCFEELPETRDTLEGNSLQKAEYVFEKFRVPCFADDTGLEVAALNNEPGVYSARYAGAQRNPDDNNRLLLMKLVDAGNRAAQFRTVFTFIDEQGIRTFEGVVKGAIIHEKRGTMGFGYDPLFVPDGYTTTFAEMTIAEKGAISHRAIALKKLIDFLRLHYQ